MPIKIALLTTDNRQHLKDYGAAAPFFGTAPEALLQGLAGMSEAEVHVVSCTQRPMSSPEKLAPNIWFHSLLVPKLGWMRTGYQGCIRAVRRKLAALQPDLVHGQGTERDCAISAVFSGFPSVLTVHGNMRLIARVNQARPFTFDWLAARLEKITIPRSRGVVCITNYTRDAVRDLARRTWVVPNAVDASFFDVAAQPDDSQTVLCVGNISHRKNQNPFIRALDAVAAERPLRVVFLGQAPKEDPCVKEFFELAGRRAWCVFGGFANREKLKHHLQSATLLALPSLEDNCPMVVLEAMAAGVPVLAAKVGGLPDLLEDGVTGLFCDPLDPRSMADGLRRGLNDPAALRSLAERARRSARERFHPLVIARRHLEIYGEVLNTRS